MDEERLAWLKISGTLCHVWGESFFQSIVNSIGRYVKCDEETLLQTKMSEARVFVRLGWLKKVDISIKAIIDDSKFCIHLMEEDFNFNAKALIQGNRGWDDDSTEYVFSMEEETEGRMDMVGLKKFKESTEVQIGSYGSMEIEAAERVVLSHIEEDIIQKKEGVKSKNKKAQFDLHKKRQCGS